MNEWKIPGIAEALAFLKRCATIFKMAGVAVLILLLLIPLRMVRSVLRERLGRRNEAVTDITSSWGRDQKLVGPVLIVPYRYPVKSWKEQPTAGGKIEKVEVVELVTANAYFLPTNLAVSGDIKPMQLRRGIYQAVVYTGKLEFAGEFARPDFARLRIKPEEVLWDDALVAFAIPDLRGVKETLNLKWGEKSAPLVAGKQAGRIPIRRAIGRVCRRGRCARWRGADSIPPRSPAQRQRGVELRAAWLAKHRQAYVVLAGPEFLRHVFAGGAQGHARRFRGHLASLLLRPQLPAAVDQPDARALPDAEWRRILALRGKLPVRH